jgi:hypothetical protein
MSLFWPPSLRTCGGSRPAVDHQGRDPLFPAKIHVGRIAAVFGIVGVSMWGATQWAAGALGHQAGRGAAWFTLWGYPVYLPWQLFE